MEYRGIRPNLVCYNTVIHCCAVCGDAERAILWYQRLQNEGLKGRKITFSYLLSACVKAGRKDLAAETFRLMALNGLPADHRDYAKLEELHDGQQYFSSTSLACDIDGYQQWETSAQKYGIVSGAFNGGSDAVARDSPSETTTVYAETSEAIGVSTEAWSTSHRAYPSATDDGLSKYMESLERSRSCSEDEPSLTGRQHVKVSNKISVPNIEHIARSSDELGEAKVSPNELISCLKSLTSLEPTDFRDEPDSARESTNGPNPSEVACVPLAWLNGGAEL
eukprot:TRINITY_DN27437_c0_g1_i1.p1 TRINITY_DN27437_c0_g1~~TRINITY_DN27437_c0_g1_i1.p1  ORF type:complete len:305 (+),score=27.14 TRINITY_DN27437_c0_g1_i1:80-916(+)